MKIVKSIITIVSIVIQFNSNAQECKIYDYDTSFIFTIDSTEINSYSSIESIINSFGAPSKVTTYRKIKYLRFDNLGIQFLFNKSNKLILIDFNIQPMKKKYADKLFRGRFILNDSLITLDTSVYYNVEDPKTLWIACLRLPEACLFNAPYYHSTNDIIIRRNKENKDDFFYTLESLNGTITIDLDNHKMVRSIRLHPQRMKKHINEN